MSCNEMNECQHACTDEKSLNQYGGNHGRKAEARKEGRKEGSKEARKQGRKEGINDGIHEIRAQWWNDRANVRRKDGRPAFFNDSMNAQPGAGHAAGRRPGLDCRERVSQAD